MLHFRIWIVAFICQLLFGAQVIAAELPHIRVGTLQFGTVNWELEVIRQGLDRAKGFVLEPVVLADKDATAIALQAGDVDAIVTDWIWVARQRAAGRDYTFVPYSLAVGALMADPAKGINEVKDLAGKRIGIAGGPDDKSWVLLQAYAKKSGIDLAKSAEIKYAAPPMLNELIERGELDAVLNFWHFNARLKGKGYQQAIKVEDILPQLGLPRTPPLLGWVFSEAWAKSNPQLVKGLLDSSFEAKSRLASEDQLWDELRPQMKAEDEAVFTALKAGYRDGIPTGYDSEDVELARQAMKIMSEINLQAVGELTDLPAGTFWAGYRR
jgi:NitT/TauT family transport system substrate-binding protein